MSRIICVRISILAIVLALAPLKILGGTPDPERAAMFALFARVQSKALRSQDAILGTTLANYKMNRDVIKSTNKFIKEYNDWLDSFGDVLTIAANLYGIYYNVDRIIGDVSEFKKVTKINPKNLVAVSLSPSKNKVYASILNDGLDVVTDLEMMVTGSKTTKDGKTGVKMRTKMSLMERTMKITEVRQRLQDIDRKMRALNRMILYTSLYNTYYEVTGDRPYSGHHTRTLKEILADCQSRWSFSLGKPRYRK